MNFVDLISPYDTPTFLADWWERRPLFISRSDPGFYGETFAAADIDRLLVQSRPTYPQIRILKKSTGVAWDALSEGWLRDHADGHLAAVHDAYANGNTVVVEMRRLWRTIDRLCRSAEILLNHSASAELYMTPAGSQAFDIHYDLHDVFLLQLEGSKKWRLYDPIFPLPTAEASPNTHCRDLVGEPTHTRRLKKGDLLYIPRGFPHQGLTTEEPSLHITIGIYPYRWHDLAVRALALASADHPTLRGSLPAGFLSGIDREFLRAQFKACLAVLDDPVLADRALAALGDEFLDGLAPVPDGQLAQLDRLPAMTGDTLVERREHMPGFVSTGFGTATLRFPSGRLEGPSSLADAFRRISTADGAFRVADLDGSLDIESKLVLARRLVRDGLLRVREIGPNGHG